MFFFENWYAFGFITLFFPLICGLLETEAVVGFRVIFNLSNTYKL